MCSHGGAKRTIETHSRLQLSEVSVSSVKAVFLIYFFHMIHQIHLWMARLSFTCLSLNF